MAAVGVACFRRVPLVSALTLHQVEVDVHATLAVKEGLQQLVALVSVLRHYCRLRTQVKGHVESFRHSAGQETSRVKQVVSKKLSLELFPDNRLLYAGNLLDSLYLHLINLIIHFDDLFLKGLLKLNNFLLMSFFKLIFHHHCSLVHLFLKLLRRQKF